MYIIVADGKSNGDVDGVVEVANSSAVSVFSECY